MKKLVLFIGLVVAMFITITQPTQLLAVDEQQTTTQQVDVDQLSETEAERIIDKYTSKIGVFFENLARDLTPIAEATYKSYVRYLWADIITGLISLFIIVSLIIWFISLQVKVYTKYEEKDYPNVWFETRFGDTQPTALSWILYFTNGIALVVSLFLIPFIPMAVKLLLAPEIVVAKEVLNLL